MRSRTSAGELIARVLAGAWRATPPVLSLAEDELAVVAPLLCRSGAGALAWWRLRHHPLAHTPTGQTLRNMYLLHRVEAQLASRRLVGVLERLRNVGVEPLLMKGWAIGRHYREAGLRPYSDVDLIVRADEYDRAREALATGLPAGLPIDLHAGTEQLDGHAAQRDGHSFEDLTARAEEVPLGGTTVRVLGPEDHLLMLSVHALRHDVSRPIWLCDLAVALEVRSSAFDWTRCLGKDRRVADWVACALGLAQSLLGAELDGTPAAARAADLPGWLVPAVLRRWARSPSGGASARIPLGQAWSWLARDPALLREALVLRWDRPIRYTLDLRRPFTAWARWPIQAAAVALSAPRIVREFRWRSHPPDDALSGASSVSGGDHRRG